MNQSAHKQAGLTFWGLCFIIFFIGIVVLFTMRAFPLYNEKFQVVSAINSVASRPDATELSNADVRKYFMRNIQISNVDRFSSNNVTEYVDIIDPRKRGEPRIMHVHYEARNVLFSDLYLLMDFDVKKPLRGPE